MRPDQLFLGNGIFVHYSRSTGQVHIEDHAGNQVVAEICLDLHVFQTMAKWVERQQRWED